MSKLIYEVLTIQENSYPMRRIECEELITKEGIAYFMNEDGDIVASAPLDKVTIQKRKAIVDDPSN